MKPGPDPVRDGIRILQIGRELRDFLECVKTRRRPSANASDSGVKLAQLIEANYESGRTGQPVALAR